MSDAVLEVFPLPSAGPWPTIDPFLFCVHHNDLYPPGREDMSPDASLAGRRIGQDFSGKDGWSMYHGERAPGFPQHPHRGFETVTVARHGHIDHADSLGAAARFGDGDLQWMTAGRGVVHSEMFPLLDRNGVNHTELFQIWLNLPARSKMAAPHFTMFWKHEIPSQTTTDAEGRRATVVSYAKPLGDGQAPPAPPPDSWAADPANGVGIWTIKLDAGATWTLPASEAGIERALYFFEGASAEVAGRPLEARHGLRLTATAELPLRALDAPAEILLLEGRPIGEPVAQHGPFVMNSQDELRQAFEDYRRTGFGGWSWPDPAPVRPRAEGRFAAYPDGRVIRP